MASKYLAFKLIGISVSALISTRLVKVSRDDVVVKQCGYSHGGLIFWGSAERFAARAANFQRM
jgi:hypothetical protein